MEIDDNFKSLLVEEVTTTPEDKKKLLDIVELMLNNTSIFLKTFNRDILKLPQKYIDDINKFVSQTIGKGGQGEVFSIYFRNLILKKSLCEEKNVREITLPCSMLKNSEVFVTKYFEGTMVTLPDSISESIIGYIMNGISRYNTNFVANYGTAWLDDYSLSFSERLKGHLFVPEIINNGKDFIVTIMQYLHGIATAQQLYKFCHNDSHLLNILYEDTKKGWDMIHINTCISPITTEHKKHQYYLHNPGWNLKINDYGMSRITDSNTNITFIPTLRNINNFNQYSHCVDYLTLFGCLFNLNYNIDVKNPLFKAVSDIREIILKDKFLVDLAKSMGFNNVSFLFFHFVAPTIFSPNIGDIYLESLIKEIYFSEKTKNSNYYRPNFNAIVKYSSQLLTPDQVFVNIANFLIGKGFTSLVTDTKPEDKIVKQCHDYLSIDKTKVTRYTCESYDVVFSNVPFKVEAPPSPYMIDKTNGIQYKQFIFSDTKKPYNMDDFSSYELKQYVNVVRVSSSAIGSGKYKFISDCCGGNIYDFFQKKNRYGVAINGVFFDIKRTNLPIGYYKQTNVLESSLDIPELFKPYYAYIAIRNIQTDNKPNIRIVPISEVKNPKVEFANYEFISICGPLLIDQRTKFVFTEELLRKEVNGINIFSCINHPAGEKFVPPPQKYPKCNNGKLEILTTDKVTPSCYKINPGELYHGANLNPRSILAINDRDKLLYFITIEGRNMRGSGQDFIKSINTLNMIDRNITTAINLDGGRSSVLAWRIPSNPSTIYNVNPTKFLSYPTGNIFGIVTL